MTDEDPIKDYTTANDLVQTILQKDQRARNDDKWLIYRVWHHQLGQKDLYIPFDKLPQLLTPETITRVRRKLNEQGKHLPTDPQVIQKRRIRQQALRNYFAQNPTLAAQYHDIK